MIKLCTHELKKKKEEKITTKKTLEFFKSLDSKIDLSSWLISLYENKTKYIYILVIRMIKLCTHELKKKKAEKTSSGKPQNLGKCENVGI